MWLSDLSSTGPPQLAASSVRLLMLVSTEICSFCKQELGRSVQKNRKSLRSKARWEKCDWSTRTWRRNDCRLHDDSPRCRSCLDVISIYYWWELTHCWTSHSLLNKRVCGDVFGKGTQMIRGVKTSNSGEIKRNGTAARLKTERTAAPHQAHLPESQHSHSHCRLPQTPANKTPESSRFPLQVTSSLSTTTRLTKTGVFNLF